MKLVNFIMNTIEVIVALATEVVIALAIACVILKIGTDVVPWNYAVISLMLGMFAGIIPAHILGRHATRWVAKTIVNAYEKGGKR